MVHVREVMNETYLKHDLRPYVTWAYFSGLTYWPKSSHVDSASLNVFITHGALPLDPVTRNLEEELFA